MPTRDIELLELVRELKAMDRILARVLAPMNAAAAAAATARSVRTLQIACGDWRERTDIRKGRIAPLWRIPKSERLRCGARTRRGTPCQARCTVNGTRCRLHGGLSTGPKTEEGRERIRESNRRRAEKRREAAVEKDFAVQSRLNNNVPLHSGLQDTR